MRLRHVARLIATLGAVALITVAFVAGRLMRSRAPDRALDSMLASIPASMVHANDFRWTQMKNGQKQWELTAREGTYSEDRTRVILDLATLRAWAQDGHQMVLHAAEGVLDLAGNQIERADLRGGVTIDYAGFVLDTPEAVFFPQQDRLEASGVVHVRSEGMTVEGVGMEAHLRSRLFTLKHNVTTVLTAVKGSRAS